MFDVVYSKTSDSWPFKIRTYVIQQISLQRTLFKAQNNWFPYTELPRKGQPLCKRHSSWTFIVPYFILCLEVLRLVRSIILKSECVLLVVLQGVWLPFDTWWSNFSQLKYPLVEGHEASFWKVILPFYKECSCHLINIVWTWSEGMIFQPTRPQLV